MAIYEMCCRACKHKFEVLILKETDHEAEVCPACGRKELDKNKSQFSAASKRKRTGRLPNSPEPPS